MMRRRLRADRYEFKGQGAPAVPQDNNIVFYRTKPVGRPQRPTTAVSFDLFSTKNQEII